MLQRAVGASGVLPADPLKQPRPLSFFGPDDYDGSDEDVAQVQQEIVERQRQWDQAYQQLSVWRKLCVYWRGHITEPIGTSGGLAAQSTPSGTA